MHSLNFNINIEELNKIWLKLNDEASRVIFKERLSYSMLNDVNGFLKTMLGFCNEEDKRVLKNVLPNGGKKIAIYGAGVGGHHVLGIIGLFSDEIIFIDNNEKSKSKWGTPVYSFEEFIRFPDLNDWFIFISVGKLQYAEEIINSLEYAGIRKYTHFDEFSGIGQPCDFLDYLYARKLFIPESYPFRTQYFDLPELELSKSKKEIFVDAGSYNGETAKYFLNFVSEDSVVYSFEPNKLMYDECQRNLQDYINVKIFPYGLYSDNTILKFNQNSRRTSNAAVVTDAINKRAVNGKTADFSDIEEIETRTLDSLVESGEISDKITFIKMDIEGSELSALIGAEKVIREDKPRLAICIYHNPEDVWEIPEIILKFNPDYKLFVRHYYPICVCETVIYAV